MSFLDWMIRITDFPSSKHLAEGVPGSPRSIQPHLETLVASRRWNHLYFEEADGLGDVIRDHVAVTKSFHNPRIQIEVNVSAERRPTSSVLLADLKRVMPAEFHLNHDRAAQDDLVVDTLQTTTTTEKLARFVDAIYREVYGCTAEYKLIVVAQYVKWRRL